MANEKKTTAQELAELKAENLRLSNLINKVTPVTFGVTESGHFSITGIKKGPPSVYTRAQFERLLNEAPSFLAYMTEMAETAERAAKSWVKKPRTPRLPILDVSNGASAAL